MNSAKADFENSIAKLWKKQTDNMVNIFSNLFLQDGGIPLEKIGDENVKVSYKYDRHVMELGSEEK